VARTGAEGVAHVRAAPPKGRFAPTYTTG
jgi:hypothetical protein